MIYRTILVDDEPLAIQRLRGLLQKYDTFFQVVGEASSGNAALQLIEQYKPDIVFLDIEMPEMNGFELLQKLTHIPMVIFATAYDAYAIKAFEENSVDYLLKPIEEERLAKTVEKIKNLKSTPQYSISQLNQLLTQFIPKKEIFSLTVKCGDRFMVIPLEDVSYFQADDRYVFLYTLGSQHYITDLTISMLEEKLPEYFIRISRSVIVNYKQVREIQRYFAGKLVVLMRDKTESRLQTGSHYLNNLKKRMETI
ncbi:LytTR family DNA-binding domain-containing protein [Xanthocytophaga agilis]|uniref:LytTR family DNA-binding domain-containing protein n=1 Tax=Xanthocytophaga agilis TaxID=3048010 RepID=A0AAE3RBZ1_9BACT|nr:LytTR family DNA-binding domain-containing protein [Xanthocytophaga agilis]MDJ1505449.1 LytTR family DNA-binding domain-containing protein [Xanthocytophaga agilis]